MKKNKAPKFIQDWLKQKDEDGVSVENAVLGLVKEAETFTSKSGEEKKAWVVDKITSWISIRLHFPVPRSIVDSIVEYAYQAYKKRV